LNEKKKKLKKGMWKKDFQQKSNIIYKNESTSVVRRESEEQHFAWLQATSSECCSTSVLSTVGCNMQTEELHDLQLFTWRHSHAMINTKANKMEFGVATGKI
jgi:hypothetical protein